MSKYKNFLLMLKQGIKGVFQFKAQFIIIIILAFVATFILSISVSTQRNLQSSYDKIVKTVPKFDYQGNIQTNSDANSNSDPYLLATEVDNSDPVSFSVTDSNMSGQSLAGSSSFNFVLYNDGTKNDWYKDTHNEAVDTFLTRGTTQYLKDQSHNHINDINDYKKYFDTLAFYYDRELFNELDKISDNKELKSLTKYSPIAIFTKQNPYWYKPFETKNYKNANTIEDLFDLNSSTEALPHRDILNNILRAIASITGFLSNQYWNYKDTANTADSGFSKINTIDQLNSFLFGVGNDKDEIGNKWLVKNRDQAYTTDLQIDVAKDKNEDNKTLAEFNTTWKGNDDGAVYYSGLRGITNPFIDRNSKGDGTTKLTPATYNNVNSWNNFGVMTINSGANSLYDNMDNVEHNYYMTSLSYDNLNGFASYAWNPASSDDDTLFRVHNELAAADAGFSFKLRREATYFDSNSQYKFRAIILDSHENYNFTILSGRFPNTGEIAISEQFAKKNHLKVGNTLVIGDAQLLISAIATDALSYLPSQDIDNPIPNPSVSSFIYASHTTISRIWDGTKTSSNNTNSVTQNTAYFLYDNNNASTQGTKDQRKNAYLALYSTSANGALYNSNLARQFVDNGVVTSEASANLSYKKFADSPYRYSNSLQPLVFRIYDIVTYIAAAIIAIITIASVIVCVKKTIDLNSKQIGILKALGEQPGGISVNYISYALVLGIIVVPLAWVIGNVLQIPFSNMFLTYFSVQPDVIAFDWISFVIAFAVLGIGAGVFSFLSAWILTRQPVLSILTSSVKWGRLRLLDLMKKKWFKNASFSTRFSLTLTSSGSRQIILMTVVVLVASFLMSLVLAIPSVMVKVENSYYKSAKYANQYTQIPMTPNAPLSKNSISYWNGHDQLDKDYVAGNLQFDNSSARYGYYKDIESYTSTNSDASSWPAYIYDANANNSGTADAKSNPNNGITSFDQYVLSHVQQLLSIVGNTMGENYGTHLGTSFSVGMIDQIYGLLIHSLQDNTTMANGAKGYTDQKKINEAQNLSGWLTSSVPKIIGAIVGSFSGGGNTGTSQTTKDETWKQKVMDAIYAVVPSYVKGYVQKSDSRLDQFGINFDNEMYIPGQETLTTTIDNTSSKDNAMQLTGLDEYQNSLIVNKKDKHKVYLTQKDLDNIMNVVNVPMVDGTPVKPTKDIYAQNNPSFKLYDASTNTFNIPILPNKQAASAYKLSAGKQYDGWNNQTQLIQMQANDGTWFNMPKTAWAYDDTDYASYLLNNKTDSLAKSFNNKIPYLNDPKYDPSNPNSNWEYETVNSNGGERYYLEPSMLNNNKLTFNHEFGTSFKYDDGAIDTVNAQNQVSTAINDRAQFFKTFKYGQDGKPTGTYLRPYYQFSNFKLMVPSGWVNTNDLLFSGWNQAKYRGTGHGGFPEMADFDKWKSDALKNKQWFNTDVESADIPQSVKDGYERLWENNKNLGHDDPTATGQKWTVISPYAWTYKDKDYTMPDPLTNLVTGSPYWYRYCFTGFDGNPSIMRLANNVDVAHMMADTQAGAVTQPAKVNLVSVGTIDSYNDKVIVCDSNLANMLMDYSMKRNYQYNNQMFDKSSLVKAGTPDANGVVSQFDRYNMIDTSSSSFLNDDWANNPKAKENDEWQLIWPQFIKAIGGNQNIENYAPHLFYNGVLSNIDEPVEYTSQYSETVPMRIGQEAIGLAQGLGSGETSMILKSTLLSTTKHLIQQLAVLAIAIVAMLMVAIIITAALLIMLTGDIYIEQYKRFMVLLRALGYSKVQIFAYTFAPVSLFSFLAWVAGTIVAWVIVYVAVNALWAAGFAIPMGITWWPIIISFVVMFVSYAGSLFVSGAKTRKAAPSEVLTATAE